MPLLLLLPLLAADTAQCSPELFRIARSKNANVVVYEAKSGPDGALDAREPVVASWMLLADRGQREGLTAFERRLAYGFDVKPTTGGFTLTLRALAKRPVFLGHHLGCPAAFATIGGKVAVLHRIFVRADDSSWWPRVLSVEVTGVDPSSGEALSELLVP
jgi:hypothetical protein